ncbi:hypothetical protein PENTCL1PPCAC_21993, partial [Pristionchus entomophagus]
MEVWRFKQERKRWETRDKLLSIYTSPSGERVWEIERVEGKRGDYRFLRLLGEILDEVLQLLHFLKAGGVSHAVVRLEGHVRAELGQHLLGELSPLVGHDLVGSAVSEEVRRVSVRIEGLQQLGPSQQEAGESAHTAQLLLVSESDIDGERASHREAAHDDLVGGNARGDLSIEHLVGVLGGRHDALDVLTRVHRQTVDVEPESHGEHGLEGDLTSGSGGTDVLDVGVSDGAEGVRPGLPDVAQSVEPDHRSFVLGGGLDHDGIRHSLIEDGSGVRSEEAANRPADSGEATDLQWIGRARSRAIPPSLRPVQEAERE